MLESRGRSRLAWGIHSLHQSYKAPMAARKAKPVVTKAAPKPLEIILRNMRKVKGGITIDTAVTTPLTASLRLLKGKQLHAAVTDIVLFAQYLSEHKKSEAAGLALIQVAASVIPKGGGWAAKQK